LGNFKINSFPGIDLIIRDMVITIYCKTPQIERNWGGGEKEKERES
jgi:hypothetical protein